MNHTEDKKHKIVEISVVIPCFNSEQSIDELCLRLIKSLNKLNVSFEIIFINDTSLDDTINKLIHISSGSSNIKVIDLMFNVGQFRSLMCGLSASVGKYIVTMDDDLQHAPEDIEKLYSAIKNNQDVDAVFASHKNKKHSLHRRIGSFLISKINENIYGKPKNLSMSPFRILNRKLVNTVVEHKTISPVLGAIILKSTTRIINVPVEHHKRKHGVSNYNLKKLISSSLNNVINFSSAPLKFVSLVGIIISFVSFLISIYIFGSQMLLGNKLPGWSSIMVLINLYGGLILLSIGLIGEYLTRILLEVNGTPSYEIREIYTKFENNIKE